MGGKKARFAKKQHDDHVDGCTLWGNKAKDHCNGDPSGILDGIITDSPLNKSPEKISPTIGCVYVS